MQIRSRGKNIDKIIETNATYALESYSKDNKDKINDEAAYKLIVKGHVSARIFIDKIGDKYAKELIIYYLSRHEDDYEIHNYYFGEMKYKGDYNKLISDVTSSIINKKDKLGENVFYTFAKALKYNSDFINQYIKLIALKKTKLSEKEKKSILSSIVEVANNKLPDDIVLIIKEYFNNNYILLLSKSINPKVLYKDIILSKNKEAIAYYIYVADDSNLLDKLFETSTKYSTYCERTFDIKTKQNIDEWVRERIDFRYVDKNIEDLINSGNEPIVK